MESGRAADSPRHWPRVPEDREQGPHCLGFLPPPGTLGTAGPETSLSSSQAAASRGLVPIPGHPGGRGGGGPGDSFNEFSAHSHWEPSSFFPKFPNGTGWRTQQLGLIRTPCPLFLLPRPHKTVNSASSSSTTSPQVPAKGNLAQRRMNTVVSRGQPPPLFGLLSPQPGADAGGVLMAQGTGWAVAQSGFLLLLLLLKRQPERRRDREKNFRPGPTA